MISIMQYEAKTIQPALCHLERSRETRCFCLPHPSD